MGKDKEEIKKYEMPGYKWHKDYNNDYLSQNAKILINNFRNSLCLYNQKKAIETYNDKEHHIESLIDYISFLEHWKKQEEKVTRMDSMRYNEFCDWKTDFIESADRMGFSGFVIEWFDELEERLRKFPMYG